jgi:hypothetical protein
LLTQESTLSVTDLCRRRQIRTNVFYAWRRRLQKKADDWHGFVELRSFTSLPARFGIRIISGNLSIEVSHGFDPAILRSVWSCLESL